MAITADSVVVELEAKVAGYNAAIADAAGKTDAAFGRIGNSAKGAENNVAQFTGRAGNATRNLGRQIADVGASFSSGASPFLIIGQQAGQVADALADTGGKAARVAQFFAGPWGAALLAAGSVLAIFAEKALKTGDNVESLVKKLQDNADKAQLAAQAEDIFSRSLDGAAKSSAELTGRLIEQNKSQIQVAQSALAAAEAQRQLTIQNLKQEASRAAIAARDAKAFRTNAVLGPGGAGPQGAAIEAAAKKEAEANRRVAEANNAVAVAERGVIEARIPLLKLDAAAASDKSTAAIQRQEKAVNKLALEYRLASGAAQLLTGKAREAAQQTADRRYVQGEAAANRTLEAEQDAIRESEKKGPKGPSAATLARRAEAARVKAIRTDEQFNNELERLNGEIISQRMSEVTEGADLANLKKEQVQSELTRRLNAIQADEDARKYTELQAAQLREKAREVAAMKNLAISTEEIRRNADEIAQSQRVAFSNASNLASAQLAIAQSNEDRKKLEQRLLDIKYQELELAQKAILADTTGRYTARQRADAQATLDTLPDLRRADNVGLNQRYMGQYERYRQEISSADGLAESIDRIKIGTLESVTDELTNATKAALGLKGAFGDIVGELIRIGIQRRLIGPLADRLFGPAGGATDGGGGDGILGGILNLFGGGRASGGNVMGGKIYRINENGPELFQPAQSGKIYPTGQLNKAAGRASGGTVVQQSFTLDARGGVVTQELLRQVNVLATQKASQAGKAAYEASPKRSATLTALGT